VFCFFSLEDGGDPAYFSFLSGALLAAAFLGLHLVWGAGWLRRFSQAGLKKFGGWTMMYGRFFN
jgi:hypothetical protein